MEIDINDILTIQVIGFRNLITGKLKIADGCIVDDWPEKLKIRGIPDYEFELQEFDDIDNARTPDQTESQELADYRIV